MRAVPIVRSAWILVGQLQKGMIDVNIVGAMRGITQDANILTGQLVRAHQRLLVPVGPIHGVVEDRQSKHVRNLSASNDHLTMFTIVIGILDAIQVGIGPVDFVAKVVDR